MVQILATIFFSAAALSALGVIIGSLGDNLGAIRLALGFRDAVPARSSARVRVRRVVALRGFARVPAAAPLRAAA